MIGATILLSIQDLRVLPVGVSFFDSLKGPAAEWLPVLSFPRPVAALFSSCAIAKNVPFARASLSFISSPSLAPEPPDDALRRRAARVLFGRAAAYRRCPSK